MGGLSHAPLPPCNGNCSGSFKPTGWSVSGLQICVKIEIFCRALLRPSGGLMKFPEMLEEWLRFSWGFWADSLEFGHDSGQFALLRNVNSSTSAPLLLLKKD
jgi:hypothetical protein